MGNQAPKGSLGTAQEDPAEMVGRPASDGMWYFSPPGSPSESHGGHVPAYSRELPAQEREAHKVQSQELVGDEPSKELKGSNLVNKLE